MRNRRPTSDRIPPNCRTAADRELLAYIRGWSNLEQLRPDFVYAGPADFMIRHAQFWTPRPLPRAVKPMTPKHCFDNALRLSRRRRGFRYVEGYALGVIPVHHAWCVDPEGYVIDPTWASITPDMVDGNDIGTSYFGVVFDPDEVPELKRPRRSMSVLYGTEITFWQRSSNCLALRKLKC